MRPLFAILALVMALIPLIMLSCCESMRRTFPTNFVLLCIFVSPCFEYCHLEANYKACSSNIDIAARLRGGCNFVRLQNGDRRLRAGDLRFHGDNHHLLVHSALRKFEFEAGFLKCSNVHFLGLSKLDITKCGGLLFALLIAHMIMGFVLYGFMVYTKSSLRPLHLGYAIMGALIFMLVSFEPPFYIGSTTDLCSIHL